MKVVNIVGARPNFVKISPLMHAMQRSTFIEPVLLHTGQHYDYNMSESFFKELDIPEPDIYLECWFGFSWKTSGQDHEKIR